jgi:hypothetical protein
MSSSRVEPRFAPRIEAGWLYLSAGLVLIASVAIIGPLDDLAVIQYRRDRLAALERSSTDQLEAYLTFLEALEDEDPALLGRLVAAQMNRIPENEEPVGLIGTELDAHVDHWIQSSVRPVKVVAAPKLRQSWLRRLSTGEYRVWTLLAGAVMVFVGLLPRTREVAESSETELAGGVPAEDEDDGAKAETFVQPGTVREPVVHVASISPGRVGSGVLIEVEEEVEV